MKLYQIIEKTKVEGPNTRFCIWTQGCSRHCKGCYMTQTWDFNGGFEMSVDEVFEKIKNTKDIEGVTFLGGEPFEQAEELSLLSEKIKAINLSILCFTGFTYEELKSKNNSSINKFLNNIDVLIDSPFEMNKFDLSRPWVGSSNQRYIFLTDRYNEEIIKKYKNKIEVRISKSGVFCFNGMGDFSKITADLIKNKV